MITAYPLGYTGYHHSVISNLKIKKMLRHIIQYYKRNHMMMKKIVWSLTFLIILFFSFLCLHESHSVLPNGDIMILLLSFGFMLGTLIMSLLLHFIIWLIIKMFTKVRFSSYAFAPVYIISSVMTYYFWIVLTMELFNEINN